MRIEICGPLGVGKTTLAKRLAELTGWELLHEPVESHPFLEAFYEAPQKFSLEADLFFLLNHLHQVKAQGKKDVIFDRSFIVSRSYASFSPLAEEERNVLRALDAALQHLGPAALIVNLVCPSEFVLQRIAARNREIESSVDIGFVSALNDEMQKQIRLIEPYNKVLHVDMLQYDFVNNPDDAEKVLELIMAKLAEPAHYERQKTA